MFKRAPVVTKSDAGVFFITEDQNISVIRNKHNNYINLSFTLQYPHLKGIED